MAKKSSTRKKQRKTVVKDQRVTLRLDSELLGAMEQRAEKERTTVSGLMTRALLYYMDNVPPPGSGAA